MSVPPAYLAHLRCRAPERCLAVSLGPGWEAAGLLQVPGLRQRRHLGGSCRGMGAAGWELARESQHAMLAARGGRVCTYRSHRFGNGECHGGVEMSRCREVRLSVGGAGEGRMGVFYWAPRRGDGMPAVMRSRVLMARASVPLEFVVAVFAKLQLQRTCRREPLAREPAGLSRVASAFTSSPFLSLRAQHSNSPPRFSSARLQICAQFIAKASCHRWGGVRLVSAPSTRHDVLLPRPSRPTRPHPAALPTLDRSIHRLEEYARRWVGLFEAPMESPRLDELSNGHRQACVPSTMRRLHASTLSASTGTLFSRCVQLHCAIPFPSQTLAAWQRLPVQRSWAARW
jgi:hypothetical protein